jgi:acetyl esterase/lipase
MRKHVFAILAAMMAASPAPVQADTASSTERENQSAPTLPPTHARVSYGEHPSLVMDVWLAKSEKPAPVVVYIHGGGWEGGDRGSVQKHGLHAFLDAGISVATIDYRLITPAIKAGITPPVRWPLGDAARAIQFIRSKAREWNLDKTRIGLTGGSAGGCSSLWLAMHHDMADPKSPDPVARESTRITCAGVFDAQTSLDAQQLRAWFQAPKYGAHAFGFLKEKDGRSVSDMDACLANRERLIPWIKEYSPIEHASADDPPIFLIYGKTPQPAGQPQLDSVHGAAFGFHLKERLDALGVECHLAYPALPTDAKAPHIPFLIQKLSENSGNKSASLKVATSQPWQPIDITKLPQGIKHLDLFLLMGQSNMAGTGKLPTEQTLNPRIVMMHKKNHHWYVAQHPLHFDGDPVTMEGVEKRGVGPGLSFAEAILAREPDVMIGLIPCARGGSKIAMWQKGNGTSEYDLAIQRARLALANGPEGFVRLRGALWLQGESNSTENGCLMYEENFLKVVDNLRADLQQPELPFIACTIGSFIADRSVKRHITKPEDQWNHWSDINNVFLKLPSLRAHTACVDAQDLKDGHTGDYVHYNSEAQALIGKRFAEKYLQLITFPESKK